MTNFEFIKTLPDEQSFVKWLEMQYHGFCYNQPNGRKRCLQDEYRGKEGGKRCKIDWLKTEMAE